MSGLKLKLVIGKALFLIVSPYIGEWIEIDLGDGIKDGLTVSPYIGEWIEI